MSLRSVRSSQSSIALDWAGVSTVERTQYFLQMKDRLQNWVTVYSGYKTQAKIEDLYSGEAFHFRLTSRTEDGNILLSCTEKAFATKESQSLTHLHRAIKSGNVAKAQKFLKIKGSLIDAYDEWGRSPLMVCVWCGKGELVALMLTNGAEVDLPSCQLRQTALMIACSRGDVDIVQQLSDHGASWSVKDRNGLTAMMYAVDASHMGCLEIALDAGSNLESRDGQGWTPLMRAVMLKCPLEIINKLLDRGASVAAHDSRHVTCLMLSALSGRVEVVRTLVARGADATERDVYCNTALDMANTRQYKDIVGVLRAVTSSKDEAAATQSMSLTISRGVSAATSLRAASDTATPIVLTQLLADSPKLGEYSGVAGTRTLLTSPPK